MTPPLNSNAIPITSFTNTNTIGVGIKRNRLLKKWSLKTLSEHSGVALSTLSKVENGSMSLKVEKLIAVSNALDIDIMQLVSPDETESAVTLITGRRCITRANTDQKTITDKTVYTHHASDFSNRKLTPIVIDVLPDMNPDLLRHQGEEFLYVLEGRIEALTEFYEPIILNVGDSMYIDSTMAHNIRSLDGQPARVLNVSSAKHTTLNALKES